jgi:hypothetical protein
MRNKKKIFKLTLTILVVFFSYLENIYAEGLMQKVRLEKKFLLKK